jgi:hypothetical protein
LIENQSRPLITDKKITDNEGYLIMANELNDYFNNRFKPHKIEKFIIDPSVHTETVAIASGTLIYFSTKEKIQTQTDKLETVVKQKIKNDFLKKKYIDLRFGDMVYYQ